MESRYIFFTESEIYDIQNEEDLKFLKEFSSEGQPLIENVRDRYKINFVGEVITPNNIYFSLPKNMLSSNDKINNDNVLLIKKVLVKYAKDIEGKDLVVTRLGSYTSERAYFNKLKEYFLDFITYEFIYPLKRKKVHSKSPVEGGRISIIDTDRNRKRYGGGMTYKTKDVINSDDWMLDDIYYFTIKELENRLGVSQFEIKQIDEMAEYLKEEGYNFNTFIDGKIYSKNTKEELLDFSNTDDVITAIKKSDVGVIHNPIKNTLIEYYENKQKAAANSSVNVIFTKNFEKVWELILQEALENRSSVNSDNFRSELKDNFNKVEIIEKFIPVSLVQSNLNEYPLLEEEPDENSSVKKWMSKRGSRYFACQKIRLLLPDIFVELQDGRRFLGDAKYYKDPSNSNYDKEFYIYNKAQDNIYPMVIFAIPDGENIDMTIVPRNGYRRSGENELLIITVCVKDLINDAINDDNTILVKSIRLIEKYTRKPEWLENN
jgi:hypothetical protein